MVSFVVPADSAGGGGGGSKDLTYIRKDDPISAHFLGGPDTWVRYESIWDNSVKLSDPRPPSEDMEGYEMPANSDRDKPSTRYLAHAWVTSDKDPEGYATILEMPYSTYDDLLTYYEKRPANFLRYAFSLSKSGSGKNGTKYQTLAEPAEIERKVVDGGEYPDYDETLGGRYDAWLKKRNGDDEDESDDEDDEPFGAIDDEPAKPLKARSAKLKKKPAPKPVEEDDEDEEEMWLDDDFDFESEEEEEDVMDIDDIMQLDSVKIKELAAENGVKLKKGMKKLDVAEAIVEAMGAF